MLKAFVAFTIILLTTSASGKSISDFTDGMGKKEGFYNLYHDNNQGKVYLVVDRFQEDFIYKVSLPGALGSN
ncbi:MAG: hypothetical protein QNL35_00780, partial [Emcibacteraceae bacterium]